MPEIRITMIKDGQDSVVVKTVDVASWVADGYAVDGNLCKEFCDVCTWYANSSGCALKNTTQDNIQTFQDTQLRDFMILDYGKYSMETAERLLLTFPDGTTVFDTDLSQTYYGDGSTVGGIVDEGANGELWGKGDPANPQNGDWKVTENGIETVVGGEFVPSPSYEQDYGDSSTRPESPYMGYPYFDTFLGHIINYNGTIWVDALGDDASVSSLGLFLIDCINSGRIVYVGDSIGAGFNATDTYKLSHRAVMQNSINSKLGVTSMGYCSFYYPSHNAEIVAEEGFTRDGDLTKFGGGCVTTNGINNALEILQNYKSVNVVYEGGGGSFQIILNGDIVDTIDTSLVSGVNITQEYIVPVEQIQAIRIVAADSTPTDIYGCHFYGEDKSFLMDSYVRGGVGSPDIVDHIDTYTGDSPVFYEVMFNDANASVLKANARLVIDKCVSNGVRTVLFDTTVYSGQKEQNANAFVELAAEYPSVTLIRQREIITVEDTTDNVHPNNSGHLKDATKILDDMSVPLIMPPVAPVSEKVDTYICGDESLSTKKAVIRSGISGTWNTGDSGSWVDDSTVEFKCRFRSLAGGFNNVLLNEGWQRMFTMQVYYTGAEYRFRVNVHTSSGDKSVISLISLNTVDEYNIKIAYAVGKVTLTVNGVTFSRSILENMSDPYSGNYLKFDGTSDVEVSYFKSTGWLECEYALNDYGDTEVTDGSGNLNHGNLGTAEWSRKDVAESELTPVLLEAQLALITPVNDGVIRYVAGTTPVYPTGDPFWPDWSPHTLTVIEE